MPTTKEDLNQREVFPHPTKIEPVNETQLQTLGRMLGVGAIVVDLYLVDNTVGRGVLKGNDRCLWTEDGKRITIQSDPNSFMASISWSVDPLYARLKAGKGL